MRWSLRPLMWFAGKPRPLLIAVCTIVQLAVVVTRAVTGHGLRLGGVIVVATFGWLTIRQWKAKKKYPDGYPLAKSWSG